MFGSWRPITERRGAHPEYLNDTGDQTCRRARSDALGLSKGIAGVCLKEGLTIWTFLCGTGMHRHFSCAWRVPRTRIRGQSPCKRRENARHPQGTDLIDSQERIDQTYLKTRVDTGS